MNVIGGFSAPPNGVRRSHSAKISSRQKQETPSSGLSGTHSLVRAPASHEQPARNIAAYLFDVSADGEYATLQ
jgi:hypothetical protein